MPITPLLLRRATRWTLSCVLLQNVPILFRLPGFTLALKRCPVCGGEAQFEARNRCTALERCHTCGHVFSRQAPGPFVLKQLYRDNSFWVGDKGHQGISEVRPGPEWEGYLGARIGILKRSGVLRDEPGQRVFEIGCSEGMLLYELGRLGHEAEGCEINSDTAEIGARSLGVKIHIGPFESYEEPQAEFDAIATFHTLEHLVDPHIAIRKIQGMLKPDGGLVVEVPTGEEEYHNIFHVHFFEAGSLRRLLELYFEEVDIEENHYSDPWGTPCRSLFGIGRKPRPLGID